MSKGELPFKYLGVPLSSKKLTVMQCSPLIKKILARIECWSAKMLSYAGRVQLIKSVLFGIQAYWSQIFLLPQKVLKLIQTACRTFLWTGKSNLSRRALVAWEKVSLPKNAGGLGIVNLSLWNKAAIGKLFWSLNKKKDRTWIQWVHGYYIKGADLQSMTIPVQCSWITKKVIGAREMMREVAGDQNWMQKETFSIGQLYRMLLGEVQQVEWRRLIMNNDAPPKCIFMSWLLMHKGLVTVTYLQRLGINVEPKCCFCELEVENLEHLFFACRDTGSIWEQVSEWCGMKQRRQEWNRVEEKLLQHCKTRAGYQALYRCMFSVIVYLVWKERNARRMAGKRNTIEEIVHQCKVCIAWCGYRNAKIGKVMFR